MGAACGPLKSILERRYLSPLEAKRGMSFRPSQGYVLGSDGLNPPFLVSVRTVPLTDGSWANFLLFNGGRVHALEVGEPQNASLQRAFATL